MSARLYEMAKPCSSVRNMEHLLMPRLFFGCFTSISSLSLSVLWIASSQEMEIKSLPLVHPQRLGQGWDHPAPIQTCPLTDY